MDPTEAAWTALYADAEAASRRRIVDLYAAEPDRLEQMTTDAAGLHLDLSKQPWSQAGFAAALTLARTAGVEAARGRLFAGEPVNRSEDRAVMHMALRAPDGAEFTAKARILPRCGPARSPERRDGRSGRWSTSASAAPTWGRGWSGRRCARWTRRSSCASPATWTDSRSPRRCTGSTRRRPWWWRCRRPSPPRRPWPTPRRRGPGCGRRLARAPIPTSRRFRRPPTRRRRSAYRPSGCSASATG